MKKLLTLALLQFTFMQTWADTWTDSNGVAWTYTVNNGEATITASSKTSGDLVIPSMVNEYPVVSIGNSAFYECTGLTSVVIPEGVTIINYRSFEYCSGLTSVTFPSSLTTIESEAFYGCSGLTSVTIPANVSNILDYAFDGCDGLTSIWVESEDCYIDMASFSDTAYANAVVYVPAGSLSYFQNESYWSLFEQIVEFDNLTVTINDITYQLNSDNTATVIPDNYSELSPFIRVRIPATFSYSGKTFTVTSIAEGAFSGCTELSVVALPATLTSIGDYAFADCPPYLQVFCHNPTPPAVNSNAFPASTLAAGKTLWVLDGNLGAYQEADVWKDFDRIFETTDFGSYKFQLNDDLTATVIRVPALTELEIPDKFYYADGYEEIWYEVTGIGAWMESRPSTTKLVLPSGLTTIGEGAFYGWTGLTEIIIPENVTTIGAYAFLNCPLTSVTSLNPTPPAISSYTFTCYETATLYVPEGSVEAYQADEFWGQFDNIAGAMLTATIDGITYSLNIATAEATVIPDNYSELSPFNRVRIPATISYSGKSFTVTSIAEGAFAGCTELSIVALPATLTSIGDYAFADCPPYLQVFCHNPTPPAVNSNAFPASTLAAGKTLWVLDGNLGAYQEADVWKDFDRIFETTDFGSYKFQLNDDLTATVIRVPALTELEIPDKFYYADGYEEIWYEVTGIGAWMESRPSTTSLVLPSSLTTIGEGAFCGWTGLTEIVIPENVTTIGAYAFLNCPLTSVICLNPTPPAISSYTFTCYDTALLYVPENSVEAYQNHEVWGRFTIRPNLAGDVDGDGMVDVADFTVLANYLLGKNPANFHSWAADVAGSTTGGPDGEIDVADLTGVANIILHGGGASGVAPMKQESKK